jgi:hypothetical protein
VAACSRRHNFAPAGEADDLDRQTGLLADFTKKRGVKRFAEFDATAGQRIETPGRRAGSAYQKDLVVTENGGTHR